MDSDFKVIISHISRLVYLHNLLGYMNTLRYDDMYFLRSRIRKRVKAIEDELGIDINKYINIYFNNTRPFDLRYLSIDE